MTSETTSTPATQPTLLGQTVSPGVAYGPVFVRNEDFADSPERNLRGDEIDAELARVRRVKEIQLRVVGSIATGLAAAVLATTNVVGRAYNELMKNNFLVAGIIAGAIGAALLLCCVCLAVGCWCMKVRVAPR